MSAVARTVDVAVDPATAFEVFTAEIGAWYRDTPYSWNDRRRAKGIRFEPGVGGRWIEVWDADSGEGYEMGRISVWEPGVRLVMSYRHPSLPPEPLTEIEVRFEGIDGGTRVTLEHRGWDLLPPRHIEEWSSRAWIMLIGWYADHLAAR